MDNHLTQHTPQTRDTFIHLSAKLLTAMGALDELKEGTPQLTDNAMLQQIGNALSEALIQARHHQNIVASLADLNMRLLRQQQSAKEAFAAGWDARLIDILAHLSDEECAALRRVLEALDDQDMSF